MDLFKQACWLHCQFTVMRYLMSNAHGRQDGVEKAERHQELCAFYVAALCGLQNVDLVRRTHERQYQLVHSKTQELTDYLDEAIGFPLKSPPDYVVMAPAFFEKFHMLALEALQVATA